jgi:hypothetical protein
MMICALPATLLATMGGAFAEHRSLPAYSATRSITLIFKAAWNLGRTKIF